MKKSEMIDKIVYYEVHGFDGTDGSQFYTAYIEDIKRGYARDLKRDTAKQVRAHYKDTIIRVKENNPDALDGGAK